MKKLSKDIRIRGIVQGVGFRPFIYILAVENKIHGYVLNDTEGVLIHAEGLENNLISFIDKIEKNKPVISQIDSIEINESNLNNFSDFKIKKSRHTTNRSTFLPPDISLCKDCLNEFFTQDNYRYNYPFITCTNCGPRFSIISDVPYDRINTTMSPFRMCKHCNIDYENPLDRRFHTQPNACGKCGPHLTLKSSSGEILIEKNSGKIAQRTVKYLLEGNSIVAIKGIGGYLLAANAKSDIAVKKLRELKKRPFKPFAVMAGSIDNINTFLYISDKEKELLLSKERPIVILKQKKSKISSLVAPGISFTGIMLPYTPFLYQLFSLNSEMVLIMTSGNISEEPIAFKDDDAFNRLKNIADYFVTYNRKIIAHSDDSVLFIEDNTPYFIRRSRGYVPVPIKSVKSDKHIISTGGDLKNCFALSRDDIIILSQHMGDLANPQGYALFKETFSHFRKIFNFSPETVIADMHPGYFTSKIASELELEGMKRINVQHHHAHIASVMEEHNLSDEIIGIAFDGTGFGTDGKLWGSEFIIANRRSFKREAHFKYFPLPGGEKAIYDVWKIGVSLMYNLYGRKNPIFTDDNIEILYDMIDKGINSPLTCSIGRIFDGVSAILGISKTISSEAEAAILLEEAAAKSNMSSINSAFLIPYKQNDITEIDTDALIEYIINLLEKKHSIEDIAFKFHASIAKTTVLISEKLCKKYSIKNIALSGGVFQNRLLLSMIRNGLIKSGFTVYTNTLTPSNDGCIALGQIAIGKELISL